MIVLISIRHCKAACAPPVHPRGGQPAGRAAGPATHRGGSESVLPPAPQPAALAASPGCCGNDSLAIAHFGEKMGECEPEEGEPRPLPWASSPQSPGGAGGLPSVLDPAGAAPNRSPGLPFAHRERLLQPQPRSPILMGSRTVLSVPPLSGTSFVKFTTDPEVILKPKARICVSRSALPALPLFSSAAPGQRERGI